MRIALVSDFFCPNAGGVETHIYFLAQCFLKEGHHVVVITHGYGSRKGIRYLSGGLKVYYIPFLVFYNGCSFPTIIGDMPWYRWILLRERVQIVHGHSTFSSMAHVALYHGWQLGLRTVFTDHSLFGFADASSILVNTLLMQYSLAPINKAICVSYTSKENTALRGQLDPSMIYTIPNAIEPQLFRPDPRQFYGNPTTVVFLGRLVYRKGADLLCDVIPRVCTRYRDVHFIIAGDGEKRVEIEQMLERTDLQLSVRMLGMLPHDKVRDVLVQGQIFLNTSLTEAFCTSIIEAASCGLHVVSTRVGGVPEVLPPWYVTLADPTPRSLFTALCEAIDRRANGELPDPVKKHEDVSKMLRYVWSDVAQRTIRVYEAALRQPPTRWSDGLRRYRDAGIWFGIVWIIVSCFNMLLLTVAEWLQPAQSIPPGDADRSRLVRPFGSKSRKVSDRRPRRHAISDDDLLSSAHPHPPPRYAAMEAESGSEYEEEAGSRRVAAAEWKNPEAGVQITCDERREGEAELNEEEPSEMISSPARGSPSETRRF